MSEGSWNRLIAGLPGAHVLQTSQWGSVKARYGWNVHQLLWVRDGGQYRLWRETQQTPPSPNSLAAAAQALVRPLPLGKSLVYVPRGPLLDWGAAGLRQAVLRDLETFSRRLGGILLKIDPDVRLGTGIPGTSQAVEDPSGSEIQGELSSSGWRFSGEQVQFRNTILLDLRPAEEDLLAAMKQKTRYNIRLAMRKGVTVRRGSPLDWPALYQLYDLTARRDGFAIRPQDYYRTVWETFSPPHDQAAPSPALPVATPLLAEVEEQPVAALVLFRFARRAWFLYGMSSPDHRDKMPNYLLQWEAIRLAKAAGCQTYDLWGAPDQFDPSDPMWGVFRFKQGFQGEVVRHLGAWDLPLHPSYYPIYTRLWPKLMDLLRWLGNARNRRSAGLAEGN